MERNLRRRIVDLLRQDEDVWYVVTTGVSVKGVPDIVGTCRGVSFGWELKGEGKDRTRLQKIEAERIRRAGGIPARIRSTDEAREELVRLKRIGWRTEHDETLESVSDRRSAGAVVAASLSRT